MMILIAFWVGVCDTNSRMRNLPDTLQTFETVMNQFRGLSPETRFLVKRAALIDMENDGMQRHEIGTSDVNHHIFQLYRHLGGFSEIITNAVDLMR